MCAIYFLIFESKNIINSWLIPDTTRSYLFSRFLLISLPTEICTCFSSVHFLYVKLLTKLDFTVSCALYAFVYLTVCSEADSCWSAELAACFTAVCVSHCRRQRQINLPSQHLQQDGLMLVTDWGVGLRCQRVVIFCL